VTSLDDGPYIFRTTSMVLTVRRRAIYFTDRAFVIDNFVDDNIVIAQLSDSSKDANYVPFLVSEQGAYVVTPRRNSTSYNLFYLIYIAMRWSSSFPRPLINR